MFDFDFKTRLKVRKSPVGQLGRCRRPRSASGLEHVAAETVRSHDDVDDAVLPLSDAFSMSNEGPLARKKSVAPGRVAPSSKRRRKTAEYD